MAEEPSGSSANDDEFKQGSEPGACRNSMLIATDSYEDIAQYLKGDVCQTDVARDDDSGTSKKTDKCQSVANADQTSVSSGQNSACQHDSLEVSSNKSTMVDTKERSATAAVPEIEQNCSQEAISDISTINRQLSSLSTSDGSPHSVDTDQVPQPCTSDATEPAETPDDHFSPELDYVHSAGWKNQDKHIFILSKAGKPIYCRYGDEDRLVTLFGVMQALVSFIQSSKDSIRYMVAGDHKFVFLVREHLILVAIAQTKESSAHLLLQLTYIYNQVLSILTLSQLGRIFNTLHNYDLRRLLSGTEKTFDNLLSMMNQDPSFFLCAVRCLPLETSVRDTVAQSIAQNAKVKDLVYAILIANHQLITLVRMKRYFLHPLDLHLIFNLVNATESFKTAESWTPICLPKFDANGYLHAYISYLDEACDACLLLLTVDKDLFFTLSDCKKKIMEKLTKHQCLKAISESIKKGNYCISEAGIPELRHFLYKSRSTAQFTSPQFEVPYTSDEDRQRIFRLYQHLHYRIHCNSRPLKIMFTVGEYETLLGWVTSGFELYAVFGPLVTKPLAINSINKLLKWIKKEEDRLFILNSPTF